MPPKAKWRVAAPLEIIPFSPTGDDLSGVVCPDCREPLDLHQPEARTPDLLLGTCGQCTRWFVMLVAIDTSDAILFKLPDPRWFRGVHDAPVPTGPAESPEIAPPS